MIHTHNQFILPEKLELKLIGIVGKARSGKDTVADILATEIGEDNCCILPFALPLKYSMAWAFGLPLHEDLTTEAKESKSAFWGVSPREILQFAGTEIFREQISALIPHIGNNFWIKRHYGTLTGELDDEMEPLSQGDTVIIPDVRFPNEIDYVRRNGGRFIHLTRPGADGNIGIPGHASEAPLTNHFTVADNVTHITNDSTLEALHEKVNEFISTLSL